MYNIKNIYNSRIFDKQISIILSNHMFLELINENKSLLTCHKGHSTVLVLRLIFTFVDKIVILFCSLVTKLNAIFSTYIINNYF